MRKRNYQILFILVALAVTILFSSVGKAMDVDERILIHAIGIDYEEGEYNVSMQVFKASSAGADTPVDVSQSNIQVVTSKGRNISEALDIAQDKLGKEIFLGHLQIMVFGRNVDFSNPAELFSFCLKKKNIFLGVRIAMAENTAEEIMNTEISRGTMTAESFVQTVEMNVKNSTTINCELIDFLSCIKSPEYICMPIISVSQKSSNSGQSEESKQGEEQSNSDPLIEIMETAIIKDGKCLEQTLTQTEAQGVAWLTDKAVESHMVFPFNGETHSAVITNDGVKIWLSNENGKIIYNAKITVVAHVTKEFSGEDESQMIGDCIKKELEEIFLKAENKAFFENKADIFGIWRLLRHSYPKSYLEYKDNLEEIYDACEFRVSTDVRCA